MKNYRIQGHRHKIEHIDMDFTEAEYRELIITGLERLFQLDRNDWIENGMVRRETEYHTSHSWFAKEDHRPALEIDDKVLAVIKALKIKT